MSLQVITANLRGTKSRVESLEGRDHTVVPMVMAVEGVLNGSKGPLYYPAEELAKFPFAWDAKPIVCEHPTVANDGTTSACTKQVLEKRKVGTILNTKYEDGKLKAEAWIDNELADKVDPRLLANIRAKKITEISTGLAVDREEASGDFKGKHYDAIARNYRPDHLAILLDDVGACSVKDGAGLCRNKEAKPSFVGNAASFSEIQEGLTKAAKKRIMGTIKRDDEHLWVVDVFPNYFVVEHAMGPNEPQLIKFPYTKKGNTVIIPEDAKGEPVKRVFSYKPIGNEAVTNKESAMDKTAMIAALISNGEFTEDDKDGLQAMTDKTVEALHNAMDGKKKDDDEEVEENEEGGKKAPVANAEVKPVSADEYIANAPAEIAAVLANGLAAHRAEHKGLVDAITANKRNGFSGEQLNTKPIEELRILANMVKEEAPKDSAKPAPNYAGQGGDITGNATTAPKAEPLALPTTSAE